MSETSKMKTVKVTRSVFEHHYLASIAQVQLDMGKKEQDGQRFRWLIPSMAFSVFRVEALCNLYGSQLFPHWDHFESTSFIGKIVMISDFLKTPVDFSAEPWQTLNKMKKFRNMLAHAKPQKVSASHQVPEDFPERALPLPKPKKSVLLFSSVETAEQFSRVATELDSMWLQQSYKLGIPVDVIGYPEHEVVSVEG